MDDKTFDCPMTYSKKILPKRISNPEMELKKTNSHNKKTKEITKDPSTDTQYIEPNFKNFPSKKLENQEKIQKITKILQEIKETKEFLLKNEKSKEKTKKKIDKINLILDEKRGAVSKSPDCSKNPNTQFFTTNDHDNHPDMTKTISRKEDKDENFCTNNTFLNDLDFFIFYLFNLRQPLYSQLYLNFYLNPLR